jgi:hypothetical protein
LLSALVVRFYRLCLSVAAVFLSFLLVMFPSFYPSGGACRSVTLGWIYFWEFTSGSKLLKRWNVAAGCSFSPAMVLIFFWVGRVRLGMENRFFVEAKSFSFSVEFGKPELRLEERRKGFAGVVSLGPRCIAWLIVTVEEC